MKTTARWILAAQMLVGSALHAQDLAGSWQGTHVTASRSSRVILRLAREGGGRLSAAYFEVDQSGFRAPYAAHAVSLDGRVLRASFGAGDFVGRLAANGRSLAGTWTPARGPEAGRAQPLTFSRPTPATEWRDPVPHRVRFVTVEPDVRLEVLDFGGSGRPVVLLAGLGGNAHAWDTFAPKLTDRYHVYAITRRGFAPSSVPTSGYRADSLGDDVLAVLDSLRLVRPVLVGHSIAGQELSSIGSRRAERVAGLVYLDAAYPYAFYDPAIENNATYLLPDVQRRLATVFDRWAPVSYAERAAMLRQLADTSLPILVRDLRRWADDLAAAPRAAERPTGLRRDPVTSAIFAGSQLYTRIQGPVLSLSAAPGPWGPGVTDSLGRARADSVSLVRRLPQILAFQRGVPQARVVRLAHADHFLWRTHEAEVLREMRAFIDALPATP